MFGYAVLILVVVEDGLVLTLSSQMVMVWHSVLILIVVEDGLVLMSAISVGKNGNVS